ncbi:hypothetical protein EBU95_06310 [bacterium]|nr:hypothetical protein [bacterium]
MKDIVYHGTQRSEKTFEKRIPSEAYGANAIYFANEAYAKTFGTLIPAILNIATPFTSEQKFMRRRLKPGYESPQGTIDARDLLSQNKNNDGLIGVDYSDQENNTYVVREPEQIHILGNKQDIEGFKEFVNEEKNTDLMAFRDLNEVPVSDVTNQKKTRANEIINKLVERLSRQLGVSAEILTEEEASLLLTEAGKSYQGERGFFFNGRVYLIKDKITTETAFHEFAHVILRAMSTQNPELFAKMYAQVANTPEGQSIIESVKEKYPELKNGSVLFMEEVLAHALGKKANNQEKAVAESNLFQKAIDFILYGLKQLFRKFIFKGEKISIEKLDVDTSLDELAEMLRTENFKIESDVVTQADVVSFNKDFRKDILEDLIKVESKELSLVTKEFYKLVKKQVGFINSKNYKEIAGVLKDTMDRGDLSEILDNLKAYQNAGEKVFPNTPDGNRLKEKYMNSHAEALLNSILRFDQASLRILKEFKDIVQKIKNKELDARVELGKAFYLNNILKDWKTFTEYAKKQLLENDNFAAGHPLFSILNQIRDRIEGAKTYTDDIYEEGVGDILYDNLSQLAKNIDDRYARIIKKYKDRGEENIAKVFTSEYKVLRDQLTPENLKKSLRGELGDAGVLNSMLESVMYNQDPVILGFGNFVKSRFINMTVAIQQQYNEFINDIEPLVTAAGYTTAYSRMTMGKDMLFIDTQEVDENGQSIKGVWTFKGPYKNYKAKLKTLIVTLEAAKKELYEKNTDEARETKRKALDALIEFQKSYMHREYTEEYYKLDEFYKDEVGQAAKAAVDDVMSKIHSVNVLTMSPEDILETLAASKVHWREYKQLRSLYYADGSPKSVDSMDYKIAVRLRERQALSNKYHEWVPRPGAFENAYLTYLQSLKDRKIEGEEYEKLKNAWLSNNGVIELTAEYYQDRAAILNKIANLTKGDKNQERISEIIKTITDMISAYKDSNYHPVGSEMPEELLSKIHALELEYQELLEITQEKKLKKSDYEFLDLYNETLEAHLDGGLAPTEEETFRYEQILKKMASLGITDEDVRKQKMLMKLWQEYSDISKREFTQDYVDRVNEFIGNSVSAKEYLQKELGIIEFSISDIDMLYYEHHLENIMSINPTTTIKGKGGKLVEKKFSEWFEENHTSKDDYTGGTTYTPTRAWTHAKPAQSKYYKTTLIKNEKGELIDKIPYKPSTIFKYRRVKDSYTDENGNVIKLKTERINMLECIEKGIGIENATVDMQGQWLPRYDNADKTYVNEEYDNMRTASPKKFDLLQALIKNHLKVQTKLPKDSRLDLEAPRYRKSQYEVMAERSVRENIKESKLSQLLRNIGQFFSKSSDDFEDGFNAEERQAVAQMDLFDSEYSKIPITGMYNLDPSLVTMDILTSMTRYMQSGVKQRTLIDMLPVAKSLQSLIQTPPGKISQNEPDPMQPVTGMQKMLKFVSSSTTSVSGKGANIRKQTIDALIEREFEGKNIAGFNVPWINKSIDSLLNASSRMFFAFNLPSAFKNSFGARFQSMIEASAGTNFNWTDYGKGTVWSNMVTMEISMQVWKFGQKSVNYQLVELMDPSQGRLQTSISEGKGISESAASNVLDLSFMTNVRKWTELNSTLSVFGAMLNKELVEITDDNGVTSKITYDKAWELVDGVIKLKKGVDPEYAPGGSKYQSFVKRVHGVTMNLNGAYDSFNQPLAGRYLLYRMIMFLKKYFMSMFMNRWQGRIRKTQSGYIIAPRYDGNMDTVALGYYVEFFRALTRMFTMYKFNVKNLTESEVAASLKTTSEILFLIILQNVIAGMIFGWDDDDEERYEKLRNKSGPLPLPFVADTDYEFKPGGWFSNHLLNLTLQVEAENDSWIPLPGMGIPDYINMLKMESVGTSSTYERYKQLLQQGTNILDYYVTGNTSGLYKRDAGPYEWQQEGRFKFWNWLLKSMTLTGSTVEPIQSIKSLSSREKQGGN